MELLDGAMYVSAMIAAVLSGTFAGLGLRAPQALDRNAELWFAIVMWPVALTAPLVGGRLGTGMVLGCLVILILWSVLHFPSIRTMETPVPRRMPLVVIAVCALSTALLGIGVVTG